LSIGGTLFDALSGNKAANMQAQAYANQAQQAKFNAAFEAENYRKQRRFVDATSEANAGGSGFAPLGTVRNVMDSNKAIAAGNYGAIKAGGRQQANVLSTQAAFSRNEADNYLYQGGFGVGKSLLNFAAPKFS